MEAFSLKHCCASFRLFCQTRSQRLGCILTQIIFLKFNHIFTLAKPSNLRLETVTNAKEGNSLSPVTHWRLVQGVPFLSPYDKLG